MFSKTCEYGIMAVLFIAYNSKKDKRVGIKEIADAIDCSDAFTGKIMQQLSKNRIVNSIKGRSGGFWIDKRERNNINLFQIVRVMDGDKLYKECLLGLKDCNDKNPCPIHFQYSELRNEIIRLHSESSVEELSDKLDDNSYLKN
jgi:Rrf2 family protein